MSADKRVVSGVYSDLEWRQEPNREKHYSQYIMFYFADVEWRQEPSRQCPTCHPLVRRLAEPLPLAVSRPPSPSGCAMT